jgi:hypothetical protein
MFNKILLILVVALLGVIAFFLKDIAYNLKALNQSEMGGNYEIEDLEIDKVILPHAKEEAPIEIWKDNNLPAIWDSLQNKNITKLFLSYAKTDYQLAKKVAQLIEGEGISVYLDYPEEEILDDTKRALNSMDVFAILLTPNYQESTITKQEYELAIEKKTPTVALSVDGTNAKNIFSENAIDLNQEGSILRSIILQKINNKN